MTLTRSRLTARIGVVAAAATALVLVLASPALAHVKVSADKPQAGATDVTVQFDAEAESDEAGAKSIQVSLPEGVAPGDVSYVSGPTGWALTATADGYTVAGGTLKVHQDVTYKIKIAKLPATATSLAFKTIVTYGNGDADRWIEIPVAGQAEPPHPAPVLALQPAAVVPSSAAPTSAAPSVAPTSAVATTPAAATKSGGGSSALWWVLAAIAVVLVAGGGYWLLRRRNAAS
jgi:LPXTG-motif cell wall-anchored protein